MYQRTIALGPKLLKRLSYHFLWGLQLDVEEAVDLYFWVRFLDEHEEERSLLIAQEEALLEYTGTWGSFVRGLYWIFNIAGYRENYYRLEAYRSWKLYEEVLETVAGARLRRMEASGGFFVKAYVESKRIGVSWNNVTSWLPDVVLNLFQKEKAFPEVLKKEEMTEFKISMGMLPHLIVLGLDLHVGAEYSVSELKRVYYQKSRKFHPDRGGTEKDFVNMRSAYEGILEEVEKQKSARQRGDEGSDRQNELLDELDERLTRLESRSKANKERVMKFCEDADNVIRETIEQQEQHKATQEESRKLQAFARTVLRERQEINKQLEQNLRNQDALIEQQKQSLRNKDALKEQLEQDIRNQDALKELLERNLRNQDEYTKRAKAYLVKADEVIGEFKDNMKKKQEAMQKAQEGVERNKRLASENSLLLENLLENFERYKAENLLNHPHANASMFNASQPVEVLMDAAEANSLRLNN